MLKINRFNNIYGRDTEKEILIKTFKKSINNMLQIIYVSGPIGSGKTSVVNDIQKEIQECNGIFLKGQYDQHNINLPFNSLSKAFYNYFDTILVRDEEKAKEICNSIEVELGDNLQFVLQAFPDIGTFFKNRDASVGLPIKEQESILISSCITFFKIIGDLGGPIFLFYDNFQWADNSSIELLQLLFKSIDLKNITIVCAFRGIESNEKLSALINSNKNSKNVTSLPISPIDSDTIMKILIETFDNDNPEIKPLSDFIMRKTRGNPLQIHNILRILVKDNLIKQYINDNWNWSLSDIEKYDIGKSLEDNFYHDFEDLSDSKKKCLEYAACIGDSFSIQELFLFVDKNLSLRDDLVELMSDGYIVSSNLSARLLSYPNIEVNCIGAGKPVVLSFLHDSIYKTCLGSLSKETKQEVHLKLGLHYLEKSLLQKSFSIKSALQFILCEETIPKSYKKQLLDLYLVAGSQCLKTGAYDLGLKLSLEAKKILSKDFSLSEYPDIARDVYLNLMKSYYLKDEIQLAEELSVSLVDMSIGQIKKAEIYKEQMSCYLYLGKLKECLSKGHKALSILNYHFDTDPSMFKFIQKLIWTNIKLKPLKTRDLLYNVSGKDKRVELIINILGGFIAPAFIAGESYLFSVASLSQILLTLKHGNYKESGCSYSSYALLLSGLGNYKKAAHYSELAIKLNETGGSSFWTPLIDSINMLFVAPWNKRWEELPDLSKKAMTSSKQIGEKFILANHYSFVNQWNPHITLTNAIKEGDSYLELITDLNQEGPYWGAKVVYQRWMNLTGQLSDNLTLDSYSFNAKEVLKKLSEINYISGIAVYHIQMMTILYHRGQYEKAYDCFLDCNKVVSTLAGSAYIFDYTLYGFLLNAALYRQSSDRKIKRSNFKSMNKLSRRMDKWASINPDNFNYYKILFDAERCFSKGKTNRAQTLYKESQYFVESSINNRDKGIVLEAASRFYMNINHEDTATKLEIESKGYYKEWGYIK